MKVYTLTNNKNCDMTYILEDQDTMYKIIRSYGEVETYKVKLYEARKDYKLFQSVGFVKCDQVLSDNEIEIRINYFNKVFW